MEQMPSNIPTMEVKPGLAGWAQAWMTAVTKPNEQTFAMLTEHPNATSKTAFIWVFIAGTVTAILQAILNAIYSATGTTPQLNIPGMEQFNQFAQSGGGETNVFAVLLGGLCAAPLAGLITVLFFALGTAIVQWIAKLFGGVGTFDKMAYASAAISFPITLVAAVLTLFSAIPFVGLCISIFSFGLSLYALVLQVMAVKGVNRIGWGAAIGSVLIPGVLVFVLCACVFALGMMVLIPAVGGFAP